MLEAVLVLLRHGQSVLTAQNCFAGWSDVDLSPEGQREADEAAQLIAAERINFQSVHTSVLQRTIKTARTVLAGCRQQGQVPQSRSWRLNERHYGQLEGCHKVETSLKYGKQTVREWRRGWNSKPPQIDPEDPRWPGFSPLYTYQGAVLPQLRDPALDGDVSVEPPPSVGALPLAESPADCMRRVSVYFDQHIAPRLRQGEKVLVVAHGTPVRCLVKILERLDDAAMERTEVPSGVPTVYHINTQTLSVTKKKTLISEEDLRVRMAAVADQADPDKNPLPSRAGPRLESCSTSAADHQGTSQQFQFH